jgi:hypothetical protein
VAGEAHLTVPYGATAPPLAMSYCIPFKVSGAKEDQQARRQRARPWGWLGLVFCLPKILSPSAFSLIWSTNGLQRTLLLFVIANTRKFGEYDSPGVQELAILSSFPSDLTDSLSSFQPNIEGHVRASPAAGYDPHISPQKPLKETD